MNITKQKRPVPMWLVVKSPEAQLVGRVVQAWTKGEARARLREQAGLMGLPSGTVLERKESGNV